MTDVDIILKHSFPAGKDENGYPVYLMRNPYVYYVLDLDLTQIVRMEDYIK